jgi:hypothetical protein
MINANVRSEIKITKGQKKFVKSSLKKLLGSSLANDHSLPKITPQQVSFLKTVIGNFKI